MRSAPPSKRAPRGDRLQAELRRRREDQARRRRRRWALLALLLLLLLLLLLPCRDQDEPPVEAAGPPSVPSALVAAPPEPEPEPLTGSVARRDRPAYRSEPPEPLPWLASFRMQVAARGPRLAECFVGIQHPGTLKWTTSVEIASGRVSDHALEPTLQSAPLTREQRECALAVLSDPPYRLAATDARSTPSRVGIAIEF